MATTGTVISNGDAAVEIAVTEGAWHAVAVRLTSGSGTLTLRSNLNGNKLDIDTFTADEDVRLTATTDTWEIEVTAGTCSFEFSAIPVPV